MSVNSFPSLFFLIFQTSSSRLPTTTRTSVIDPIAPTQEAHTRRASHNTERKAKRAFHFHVQTFSFLFEKFILSRRGDLDCDARLHYPVHAIKILTERGGRGSVYSPCEDGKLRAHDVKSCEKQAEGWQADDDKTTRGFTRPPACS